MSEALGYRDKDLPSSAGNWHKKSHISWKLVCQKPTSLQEHLGREESSD